jgi:hypothetical protein
MQGIQDRAVYWHDKDTLLAYHGKYLQHLHLTHPTKGGRVTVPRHSGVILTPKTVQRVLDQAGMSADELRSLL